MKNRIYPPTKESRKRAMASACTPSEFLGIIEMSIERAEKGSLDDIDELFVNAIGLPVEMPEDLPQITEGEAKDPRLLAAAVLEGRCTPKDAEIIRKVMSRC